MSDLTTLLGLMRDPPCVRCKGREAIHGTGEIFSMDHAYERPSLEWLADWFEAVSARVAETNP